MKDWKHWQAEFGDYLTKSAIEAIQLDAQKHGEQIGWKKGMSEAKEIVKNETCGCFSHCDCASEAEKAISNAIETKKEI